MTNKEALEKGIDLAIKEAKTNGFEEGQIVTIRSEEFTFKFVRLDGDYAICLDKTRVEKKLPLAELFDPNVAYEKSIEVLAMAHVS